MLAWIFAAEFPAAVAKLILVAPAAFDEVDAEKITPERLRRLNSTEQQHVAEISAVLGGRSDSENEAALTQLAAIFERADSYDRLGHIDEGVQVSTTIYEAVWREALWLVHDDLATVQEVDDAVCYSFGLRRPVMGPILTYRMACGGTPMRQAMERLGPYLKWPWTKRREAHERRLTEAERQIREIELRVQRVESLTRIVKGTARIRGYEVANGTH